MIMGWGSYGPFSALQKPHRKLPAHPERGNKYVKQLGVKRQWRLLPFSYSLYLRRRCTIGNHHKGHTLPTAAKFFFSSLLGDNSAPEKIMADKYKHTHQPPLEDQSSQLLANEQITNQFGEQTLVRAGAYFRRTRNWRAKRKRGGGGLGRAIKQIVNIQGSKQMSICLCFYRDNTTMFPITRGRRQPLFTDREKPGVGLSSWWQDG